ncbi:synergin gamma-like isoform X1 [Biomphalaria glabrata]|uniref:Synergin gamma-like isoform X1 n=1 Tax=Biomphalaria glabrata TaxID=6526 RepID=A0A9W3AVK9_BIOGL|nr:synergin gamma-like isoform X1 [Biomphalaria glabrata]
MADNRLNQMSGFAGSGYQVGQQNTAMNVPGMQAYMPAGMHMTPMMQQQMLMNPVMRFPMQSLHMGPPNTAPPPYPAHMTSNINTVNNQQRASLSKSKQNGPQSEKEKFFEEQRRKLKEFGKPGATKVDEGKLIGSIFAGETKPKNIKPSTALPVSEDDSFGDFLQGPSTAASDQKPEEVKVTHQSVEMLAPGPEPKHQEERKDLKSIMLEYSDLSAPKKAKGFHKPTLNEVQKSGHDQHKNKVASFHESDHARRWKGQSEDLDGLFQLPVVMKPVLKPEASPPLVSHQAYSTPFVTPYPAISPPVGPPPSYTEVAGHPTSPVTQSFPAMAGGMMAGAPVVCSSSENLSMTLPDWCTYNEDQMPPVYKQVWEASLVNNKITTERLYPILLMSGLAREKLAEIWSLCNTATPGQLVKHELWLMLALIALTQHNYNTNTLDNLARCPVAPVPQFNYPQTQDSNTPATLLTTPIHHQISTPHLTLGQQLVPPPGATHSIVAPSVGVTPQIRAPQPHIVQFPRPQAPGKGTSAAPGPAPSLPPTEDNDFAEFQAAAPSGSAGAKDEGYGEFIGGGGSSFTGSGGFNMPAHTTGSGQLGNGFVSTGVITAQPQQQPASQTSKPATLSLASLPVDDKYGTNVRSFFCSSDSSTGQTSPSFEDDDFTDGRDSLSQVSTSEQSENDDLRNFESYVEEFHQKKENPDGSPLHCPFPTMQQNQALKGVQNMAQPTLKSVAATTSQGVIPNIKMPPNINIHVNPANASSFTAKNNAQVSSSLLAGTTTFPKPVVSEDDFTDFKSASFQSSLPATTTSVNDGSSLIGEEDKYGALRVIHLENDLPQKSIFEQPPPAAPDDDEWADFSAATPVNDISKPATSVIGQPASRGNKDDILQLYNSTSKQPEPSYTFGSSSSVNSRASKNGSLSGDDQSAASTPSKTRGSDLHSFADQLSSGSFSEQDATLAGPTWLPEDSKSSENWASFGGGSSITLSQSADQLSLAVSPNDSRVNKRSSSGSAVNMLSSTKSDTSLGREFGKMKDGWESGSCSISAASSNASLSSSGVQNWKNDLQPPAFPSVPVGDSEDEWSHFSGVNLPSNSAVEESPTQSEPKFVTIKKQNLGTSEIMGLFKVRDDPATLSSYQLSPQKPTHMPTAKKPAPKHSNAIHSPSDGPPPLDFGHDDEEDEHAYSRGYDFDDHIHRGPPVTVYPAFGGTQSNYIYSTAGGGKKYKENKEDSGSVHSLDLPSARPVDTFGSDNVSLSSADYNNGDTLGGSTGGAASSESKSLESLDLRNDQGETDNGYVTKDDVSHQAHPHPIQPQELLDSMPDFADKYNIEHEAQGSDRYGHEWERCLSNCYRVIMEANTLFNTISSSSVCNEVLKSTQGSQYVTAVIEIYRVVCKVMTSMRSTAISTTDLEQTLKDIDLAWNNLTAFLVGASLLPEQNTLSFTGSVLKSDMNNAKQLACGICLLSVDAALPTGSSSSINNCKLTYAGRQYHATCANFWVNCVDQTLPYLTLPELL